jgi:general secretion pathway protein E
VVMRILDRSRVELDFASLGFDKEQIAMFEDFLGRANGVVLVTGPTGSGKTTTLYTSLVRLNTPERKIFTVEDPIEYQLDRVNQIQVRPQINLTFAEILRTLLRHNPDIMMIGEMRDLETAQIAIQSALTGHLVLSTLHTNSAASSITRLLDMQVEDYLAAATISGIAAQRLLRRLCRACKSPQDLLPEMVARSGLERLVNGGDMVWYGPVGCHHCNGTGYSGQTAVIEVMTISDAIRRLILAHADPREIQRVAVAEGMRTMYEDGLLKVLDGVTSLDEVLRVTRDT